MMWLWYHHSNFHLIVIGSLIMGVAIVVALFFFPCFWSACAHLFVSAACSTSLDSASLSTLLSAYLELAKYTQSILSAALSYVMSSHYPKMNGIRCKSVTFFRGHRLFIMLSAMAICCAVDSAEAALRHNHKHGKVGLDSVAYQKGVPSEVVEKEDTLTQVCPLYILIYLS